MQLACKPAYDTTIRLTAILKFSSSFPFDMV